MSVIHTNFEKELEEKDIPFNKKEIEQGHVLYRLTFRAKTDKVVLVEIIIQNSEEAYVDAQIIYRNVHRLTDRAKEAEALELLNSMNEMRTGYYSLFLAGDGEIFMRDLLRVGHDVTPLYQTVVMGSSIVRALQDDLANALGESGKA